jgi:hypothetical protein
MPRRSDQAKDNRTKTKESAGLTMKLQIAAGVFVPILALGLWLNSQGFFG